MLIGTIINVYPFFVKFEMQINILKLKGRFTLKLLGFINIKFKFRIKNGYIYLYRNNKEIKEKITTNNVDLVFIYILTKESYFRQQLVNLSFSSNFGYNLNSCVSAVGSGYINVLAKCILSKIKNNKKSSHIFVDVEPKYNEDIFNIRTNIDMRMSLFDVTYAFLYAKYYIWRNYEKRNGKLVKRK